MNKLLLLGLISALCFGANAVNAVSADIKVGPAELQLRAPPGPANLHRNFLDRKICRAIQIQSRLEVFIGSKEESSPTETKVTIKRVVIEPYLFGIGQRGQPILQGNVISSEVIKEVNIKYSDVKYKNEEMQRGPGPQGRRGNQPPPPPEQKNEGGVNFADVTSIRVLETEKFNVPKDIDKQLEKYSQGNIQIVFRVRTPVNP